MDAARWERVESLFDEARRLPAAERRAFLDTLSAGDATLVEEVLSLLEEDARSSSLLDGDLADVAKLALGDASPATRTIGPYRVGRLLGEGGMGIVFEAERADLGTFAAIKFLRDAWLSPARRERFASEQRTLAQLNHPSIARLYDADTLPDGTPWIVMELVDGTPVTEYCRFRAAAVADRLRLLRAVCEAVQHAHRHAIIHRDLKPSNILVTAEGAVKLLDFGIAKHLASGDAAADVTRTSSRFMTPAYAAPEQHRGEHVGIYTDVYSLGVLLYELLTEHLPFDLADRPPGEVEAIISRQEPTRPSMAASTGLRARLGKAAWPDLDVLCLTAMHKDPHRRYRTVEALIRDIDHYLAGEPLEARPDTVSYRVGKFVRRNARAVSASAVVLVLVVALSVFYTLRLASARDAALAEAARTQRLQQFMMNLFQGGTSAASPAESLRVLTLVERGVQTAHGLDAEPAVQADLYETLGILNRELGNFPRADSLLKASLGLRQALYGNGHPTVASSLVALAELRSDQAEFEEAERFARDGLELARRTRGPQHVAVARATTVLGEVLVNRGQYAQAIPVLEEAVSLHSAGRDPTQDLASTLGLLANAHFYAGHYAISDTINRRLLVLDRQLYGERHPRVAHDLINLGAIQFEGQSYAEAERFYREGLAIMREWYGNDHPETASALTMVARTLISQQRPDEAVGLLGQALGIYERVYGPVHPRVASALNELGRVARNEKRWDDAESYFRRMTEIYREVYDDKHYLIGVGMSNLAGVYHERGEYREAERLFRDVLRRYAQVLASDHNLVGIAKVRLGRTLVAARNYSEAEAELRAGLDILLKQPTPPASWVANARDDLLLVAKQRE